MKQLGALKKIKVGHNNQGPSPNWFLSKVIINDLEMSRVFEFPCGFWLSNTNGETLERIVPVKKLTDRYNSKILSSSQLFHNCIQISYMS